MDWGAEMANKTITIRAVESLEAGSTIWDTDVRGFGVRRQTRDAIYVLKYRFQGRQRTFTIGRHGSPWTPDAARKEALRLLGMITSKENPRDPAAERDTAKAQPTFSEYADRYLEEYAAVHKKPRTVAEDVRNLKLHIIPAIGRQRLPEITRADMSRFHTSRRACPANANRCLATASHMFEIAEKWGLRPIGSNPCRGIDRFPEKSRERMLTAEELGRLGDAIGKAATGYTDEEWAALPAKDRPARQSAEDWRAIACYRLLLFTGARLSEILTLEWAWIDFERGVARLPDSKTGAKNLPLSAPALALLKTLPRMAENPYVLPGDSANGHFIGIQKPWQRIRKAAKLTDVRLHDLRQAS
jgi:integrase